MNVIKENNTKKSMNFDNNNTSNTQMNNTNNTIISVQKENNSENVNLYSSYIKNSKNSKSITVKDKSKFKKIFVDNKSKTINNKTNIENIANIANKADKTDKIDNENNKKYNTLNSFKLNFANINNNKKPNIIENNNNDSILKTTNIYDSPLRLYDTFREKYKTLNTNISSRINNSESIDIDNNKYHLKYNNNLSTQRTKIKSQIGTDFIMPEPRKKYSSLVFKTTLPSQDEKLTEPSLTCRNKEVNSFTKKVIIRLRSANKIPGLINNSISISPRNNNKSYTNFLVLKTTRSGFKFD